MAPAVAIGASGEHQGFPGTLSIGTPAMTTCAVELARSALPAPGSGRPRPFAAVLFVNGHGGNVEALGAAVELLASESRTVAAWHPRVPDGDPHAGVTETSLMLHLHPGRVRMDLAERGTRHRFRDLAGQAGADGLAAVTPNGVLGDPTGATAAHGAELYEHRCRTSRPRPAPCTRPRPGADRREYGRRALPTAVGMAHDHHHAHGTALARAGEAAKRPLAWALAITLVTLVVQVAVGIATGSLSLLTDGAHLLTDVGGLVLALAAVTLASRPTRDERTFGLYRLEVLSALANGVLLVIVAVWAIIEAVGRIQDPPDVPGAPVLVVGALGLVANLVALRLLSGGGSLAAEGARVEVLADAVGSVGVVVGGATHPADRRAGHRRLDRPGHRAVDRAPRPPPGPRGGASAAAAGAARTSSCRSCGGTCGPSPDVTDVHDLHVWTLTTDMDVLTAHLVVAEGADHHRVLDDARDLLADRHDIRARHPAGRARLPLWLRRRGLVSPRAAAATAAPRPPVRRR